MPAGARAFSLLRILEFEKALGTIARLFFMQGELVHSQHVINVACYRFGQNTADSSLALIYLIISCLWNV